MAKGNRTTSTPRRATAAKATKAKRRPVEWGIDDKGRQIVVRAEGWAARTLPLARLRGLRNTINDMDHVVRAFDATSDIVADDGHRLTMLSMAATVARSLMVDAISGMNAVLSLSPAMREAFAKEDARVASKGGAA